MYENPLISLILRCRLNPNTMVYSMVVNNGGNKVCFDTQDSLNFPRQLVCTRSLYHLQKYFFQTFIVRVHFHYFLVSKFVQDGCELCAWDNHHVFFYVVRIFRERLCILVRLEHKFNLLRVILFQKFINIFNGHKFAFMDDTHAVAQLFCLFNIMGSAEWFYHYR